MSARDYFDRDQYEVVDLGRDSTTAESAALRIVLNRLRQDNYALQQALSRTTEERDQWRQAYYRSLREKAEWTTKTTTGGGPLTN